MRFALAFSVVLLAGTAAFGQVRSPAFQAAEAGFAGAFAPQQRLLIQAMLIAAGYSFSIPNEDFSSRLMKSIQDFQADNGFPQDGILDSRQVARLMDAAEPWFRKWGFQIYSSASRPHSVWLPMGLGLRGSRTAYGTDFVDPAKRVSVSVNAFRASSLAVLYGSLLKSLQDEGATIHYKTIKDGWFVISASKRSGVDGYLRYHEDGPGLFGFTLWWDNGVEDVHAERIATLMSTSLSSEMLGTPMPRLSDLDVLRPAPPPTSSIGEPGAADASAAPPSGGDRGRKEPGVSAGTGFFVNTDGYIVTNNHVVEGCSRAMARPEGEGGLGARIVARDQRNDLALLKVENHPTHTLPFRVGARLGESVAAFGFPHVDLLAKAGSFTLGNITALAGIGDDSSRLTMSTPVQSGNSGGPLLDGSGNVVGVVQAKLGLKVVATTGDLPQNVNFAIKSAIVTSFLEANKVVYDTGALATQPMNSADLADKAKAASVFIACEQDR